MEMASRATTPASPLGAFVLTHAVGVQPVAAAAGQGVIEREAQVIASEEPLERARRLLAPVVVACDPVRRQARRNRHRGFDRLLIEARARSASRIEPVRSDRHEVRAPGPLHADQPGERRQRRLGEVGAFEIDTGHEQRVRQRRIGVRQHVFEPAPLRARRAPVQLQQPIGQFELQLSGHAVTPVATLVRVNSEHDVRPRAGAREVPHGQQRLFEQPASQAAESLVVGSAQHETECRHRAAMSVLGPVRVEPPAVVAHHVVEPFRARVECMPQKRQVPMRERGRLAALLQQDGKRDGAGIVVGRVAFGVVRDRVGCMLQQPGVVCHCPQVIELRFRQFGAVLERRRFEDRPGMTRALLPHLGEHIQITAGHDGPGHLAAEQVRPLPHRVPIGVTSQKVDNPVGDRVGIRERHQHTAALVEQFLGVPVRRGDHRLACPHAVRERAGDDLRATQVRREVQVRRPDAFDEFLLAHETVYEDHVRIDAAALRTPLEREPVQFAVTLLHVRVGGAQDDVHDLRMGFDDARERIDDVLNALVR